MKTGTPSKASRQPLTQISNDQIRPSPPQPAKNIIKFTPLPGDMYLGYYAFEILYCTAHTNEFPDGYEGERAFRKSRRSWLARLGIDEPPFQIIWTDESKKKTVEMRWAAESSERRQLMEITSIMLKHNVRLPSEEVSLRISPPSLLGRPPLSFIQLEKEYFFVPERTYQRVHLGTTRTQ